MVFLLDSLTNLLINFFKKTTEEGSKGPARCRPPPHSRARTDTDTLSISLKMTLPPQSRTTRAAGGEKAEHNGGYLLSSGPPTEKRSIVTPKRLIQFKDYKKRSITSENCQLSPRRLLQELFGQADCVSRKCGN